MLPERGRKHIVYLIGGTAHSDGKSRGIGAAQQHRYKLLVESVRLIGVFEANPQSNRRPALSISE
jgi:hypothetical protein